MNIKVGDKVRLRDGSESTVTSNPSGGEYPYFVTCRVPVAVSITADGKEYGGGGLSDADVVAILNDLVPVDSLKGSVGCGVSVTKPSRTVKLEVDGVTVFSLVGRS